MLLFMQVQSTTGVFISTILHIYRPEAWRLSGVFRLWSPAFYIAYTATGTQCLQEYAASVFTEKYISMASSEILVSTYRTKRLEPEERGIVL
jgi:hypothetical protein